MRRKPYFSGRAMKEHLLREEAFESLKTKHQTDDGLIPSEKIRIRKSSDGYDLVFDEDPDVEVFPVPESGAVIDTLVSYPHLWKQASVRVTFHPTISGSAPLFGVSFRQALEQAVSTGSLIKASYYLPDIYQDGRYKQLLLHLRKVDDIRGELLQLEAWQYSPKGGSAYYLHAMSTDFESSIVHFDGATVSYSSDDLDHLFIKSEKVKGKNYQKHFRLDGDLSVSEMHILATAFLPTQELYDEALHVRVIEN